MQCIVERERRRDRGGEPPRRGREYLIGALEPAAIFRGSYVLIGRRSERQRTSEENVEALGEPDIGPMLPAVPGDSSNPGVRGVVR